MTNVGGTSFFQRFSGSNVMGTKRGYLKIVSSIRLDVLTIERMRSEKSYQVL